MRQKSRSLYFIRHGERIDNIDKEWKKTAKRWDDPYLSARGHKQAQEVGIAMKNEKVDYIFCSPFTRCVQTMNGLLGSLNYTPTIYIEPGLGESLNACNDPPGRPSDEEIAEMCRSVCFTYTPVFVKCPAETGGDSGCSNRIEKTVMEILRRYPQGNLVFISHGSPVAATHLAVFGDWQYVGQCTIGKLNQSADSFECEKWGDSSHLTDRANLRDIQSEEKRSIETKKHQHAINANQLCLTKNNSNCTLIS